MKLGFEIRTVGYVDHRSRASELIQELLDYEEFLDAEKERIRPLIRALRGDGPNSRTDTTEVLMEVLQRHPRHEFTAAEAETMIKERGWTTESNDPTNAVRAALNRLKNLGQVANVGRGLYQLAPNESDNVEPDTQSAYDDPWATDAPGVIGRAEPKGTLTMGTAVPHDDDGPPF